MLSDGDNGIISKGKLRSAKPEDVMRLAKFMRLPKPKKAGVVYGLNQTIGLILWQIRRLRNQF